MENNELKKNITLDDLAVMVANGFADINERMATKDDLNELKEEFHEFKAEMYEFRDEMYEFKTEMYEFRSEVRFELKEIKSEIAEIQRQLVEIRKDIDNLYKLSSVYKKETEEENKILKMAILEIVKQTKVNLDPEILEMLERR